MDILLIVLGIICLLIGIAGCILPMLPGPPIAYAGMLLLHFTDKVQFSNHQLITWLLLVVLIQVLDYITPLIGTKKYGGSKWGNWGCVIGTFAGLFFFPPWGIIIGPFLGAVVGELLAGKNSQTAIKIGFGAFIGFLFGTILKLVLCGIFMYHFIISLV